MKDCPHAWVIEPATEPTSFGECSLCGATKLFNNSMPEKRNWHHPEIPDEEKREQRALTEAKQAHERDNIMPVRDQ